MKTTLLFVVLVLLFRTALAVVLVPLAMIGGALRGLLVMVTLFLNDATEVE